MDMEYFYWKVDMADGFEIKDHPTIDGVMFLAYPGGCFTFTEDSFPSEHPLFKKLIDPLLTQRAIEGVNRRTKGLMIAQDQYIGIYDNWGESIDDFEPVISSDQAKESALKYIYEQEMRDE